MNWEKKDIPQKRFKEQKEIQRLSKLRARPKKYGYLYYLMLIISVVYIVDEVATQIGTQMQTVIAQSLFAPVFGQEKAVARMSAFGSITMVVSALAFLYKPLADRFGRKIFLIINTFGMGVGLLLIAVSANIPVYLVGAAVIAFFIPHDMQTVYILESAPDRHRAKLFSIIKAIATLGVMLVPLLRNLIMASDITRWRYVFVVPFIMAFSAALIAVFALRETDPFIKRRLEYLNMGAEKREK